MTLFVKFKDGATVEFNSEILKIYSISYEKGKKMAIETADKITTFYYSDIKKIKFEKDV